MHRPLLHHARRNGVHPQKVEGLGLGFTYNGASILEQGKLDNGLSILEQRKYLALILRISSLD